MANKTPKRTKKKKEKSTGARPGGARPADRRVLTLLEQIGADFIEANARKVTSEDVSRAISRSAEIREAFRRSPDLQRLEADAETMLSLLADHSSGQYRSVPVWTIAVVTFAMLYVLKPIDIIPDTLPEIGRLDDALVVSHAVGLTKFDVQNYKVWRLAAEIK